VTRILHVCVHNACRSVLAEHLMRRALRDRYPALAGEFEVGSAGTHAVPGLPVHPAVGVPGRTRRLTATLVAGADLVLTATRDTRDEVLVRYPAALDRTFTLTELARLITPVAGGTRAVVAAARLARGRPGLVDPAGDDLGDPTGPGLAACANRVSAAVDAILTALCGLPGLQPLDVLPPAPVTGVEDVGGGLLHHPVVEHRVVGEHHHRV
jgi:protein-tyrosine phosphatase